MISVRRISDVQQGRYDQVWAIVRSMKRPSSWIKQVPELSPSKTLFHTYLKLKEAGEWGEVAFEKQYVPRFLEEMQAPEAKQMLNQLYLADQKGQHICLVCFCPQEKLCHRSIVAGLLQGAGCNVETEGKKDYSKYYRLYKAESAICRLVSLLESGEVGIDDLAPDLLAGLEKALGG